MTTKPHTSTPTEGPAAERMIQCPLCRGTGEAHYSAQSRVRYRDCPTCHGAGETPAKPLPPTASAPTAQEDEDLIEYRREIAERDAEEQLARADAALDRSRHQEDDSEAWIDDEEADHDCLEDRLTAAFERADDNPLDDTMREYWKSQL